MDKTIWMLQGYKYEFVEKLSEDYWCFVCRLVARNPQQTCCCGKIFCKNCLEWCKQTNSHHDKCPHCQQELTFFKDERSHQMIISLKVRCSFNKHGCTWEGELKSYEKSHQHKCLYQTTACCDCGEEMPKQRLKQHSLDECRKRKVNCPYCPAFDAYDVISEQHIYICRHWPVECPSGCRQIITRCQIEQHRETCSFQIVRCRYHEVGCQLLLQRSDLEIHEADCSMRHIYRIIKRYQKTAIEESFQSSAKTSSFDFKDVKEGIKQVNGKMKVARVLLHGAPQVGKTSVKRLIFNYPPLAKEDEQSTQLLENPVRAISTCKMMSTDQRNLEKIDETKLIKMIQMELKSYLSLRKQEEKSPDQSSSCDSDPTDLDDDSGPPLKTFRPSSDETTEMPTKMAVVLPDIAKDLDLADPNTPLLSKDEASQVPPKMPEVLADIANDLDSIDPKSTPPLFSCQFAHLVDSGGQPQFSDLLPLVFQSQSHHHIVVTPLNEKLNIKPQNCVNMRGKREKLPDALLFTHFQLIERVCQLAKASESKVIIVGTHLDKEDEEEPLAKKNKQLKHLLEKYQGSLIPKDDESIIFAVNAMAPEGKERKEYAAMLQGLILEDFCSNEEKMVPLRWMALELELSHRSRKSGEIIEKTECDEIARSLGISDLPGAMSFFNDIAVHYYYPEAVPGSIFTSVGAISSRLSKIVEASFLCRARNKEALRLQKTGELSLQYLFQLLSESPKIKCFTTDDFVQLIKHLRIVFSIDDHTLFFPSLLPVDPKKENKLDCYHPEPLVFYWYDAEYQEVRILPQSFFHALIVELLRRKEIIRLSKVEQTRSCIVLTLTLESKKECLIRLVSRVFWMEAFAEKRTFASDDISFLTEIIQKSSRSILQQLKLTGIFGDLQYGLLCPKEECGKELPHLCTSAGTRSLLKCLEDEYCKWEEEDSARLFWIKHIEEKRSSSSSGVTLSRPPATAHSVTGSSSSGSEEVKSKHAASKIGMKTTTTGSSATVILSQHPELHDAFNLTRHHASSWNDLGRILKVSFDCREQLRKMSELDGYKLEAILHTWIESECSLVTWSNFISALESIGLVHVARDVKKFLNIPDSDKSHLSRDKDSKLKANRQETT